MTSTCCPSNLFVTWKLKDRERPPFIKRIMRRYIEFYQSWITNSLYVLIYKMCFVCTLDVIMCYQSIRPFSESWSAISSPIYCNTSSTLICTRYNIIYNLYYFFIWIRRNYILIHINKGHPSTTFFAYWQCIIICFKLFTTAFNISICYITNINIRH